MDKTIEQVKQLAHRYGVPKLVLFGSRARGDHHARSDYDFAVWGCTPQQRAQFSDAVENDLDSLYSVDLVFVSEHTNAALLQNIEKDGICLLDRYHTKFENLTNAVERLRRHFDLPRELVDLDLAFIQQIFERGSDHTQHLFGLIITNLPFYVKE